MEIKFVPKLATVQKDEAGKEIPATFSGHIMVKPLPYPERMRLKAKLVAGEASGKSEGEVTQSRMETIANLAVDVMPQITGVDLKEIATGNEAKTVDQLYEDPAFDNVVSELVVAFVMGLRPN